MQLRHTFLLFQTVLPICWACVANVSAQTHTTGDVTPAQETSSPTYAAESVVVGDTAAGGLFVETGGTAAIGEGGLIIGQQSGGEGLLSVTGGTFSAQGASFIGQTGSALMELSGGRATFSAALNIAQNTGSSGIVNIRSGSFSAAGGAVTVGRNGYGELNVLGGTANLGAQAVYVGYFRSGEGVLNVAGGTLSSTGTMYAGINTKGTIKVSSGTASFATLSLGYYAGSLGVLEHTGGRLSASATTSVGLTGSGRIEITAAQTNLNNLYLGVSTTGSGIVNATNGTLSVMGGTYVGDTGTGAITLKNSTATLTGMLYVGNNSGAQGSLELDGGTLVVSGITQMGNMGAGQMTLSGVRRFTSALYWVFGGGTGTISVNGGTFNAQATTTMGTGAIHVSNAQATFSNVYAGVSGKTSTLSFGQNATATIRGYAYLSYSNSSSTNILVNGGRFDANSSAYLGHSGSANLHITSGSANFNGGLTAGHWGSASGLIHMSGGALTVAGDTTLGNNGAGVVTISAGDARFGGDFLMAGRATSNATVALSGGSMEIQGTLTVGGAGSAQLTVSGGAFRAGALAVGTGGNPSAVFLSNKASEIRTNTLTIGANASMTIAVAGSVFTAAPILYVDGPASADASATYTIDLSGYAATKNERIELMFVKENSPSFEDISWILKDLDTERYAVERGPFWDAGTLVLEITALIPEPAHLSALLGLLALSAAARRRKRSLAIK